MAFVSLAIFYEISKKCNKQNVQAKCTTSKVCKQIVQTKYASKMYNKQSLQANCTNKICKQNVQQAKCASKMRNEQKVQAK